MKTALELVGLKAYVREYESEKYDNIFICKSEKLNNYASYSRIVSHWPRTSIHARRRNSPSLLKRRVLD